MENKNNTNKIQDDKFWHVRTPTEVLLELKTSLKSGLNHNDAKKRLNDFGENKIAQSKEFSWFKTLIKIVNTILVYILLGAAIISLLSNEIIEFIVIILIILFTVFLSFIQEFKADQSVKALSKLTAKKVVVLRDSKKHEILSEHLVPGDIVLLKRGMIIPADLRIVESKGLTIDEAILTGESEPRAKISDSLEHQDLSLADQINMAFAGTHINTGSGIGIVVETGLKSQIGKISSSLSSIELQKSPLQKKVDIMSKKISLVVLSICFVLFFVMKLYGFETYTALILIGALAVAGIPESFPLALTFTLSNGIKKMAKQNAIVKDLSSVETLGTTTTICTDKTGTLTENKMRVSRVFFPDGREVSILGKGYDPSNLFYFKKEKVKTDFFDNNSSFFRACILCNESQLEFSNNEWKVVGEPTEGALLTLGKSIGLDDIVLREQHKQVHDVAFDPAKKFMISVRKDDSNNNVAYLKGAPERVLEKCTYFRNELGHEIKITPQKRKKFLEEMERYGEDGLRVLFIASKITNKVFHVKDIDNDFVFEGFVGIEDPIREDVFKAVQECQNAGIRIVMITGDYKTTAAHIGQELGLLTHDSHLVLEGHEIDNLTDEQLDEHIEQIAIFSRATPEHKLRIVKSLQRKGQIVAMTGDGVNDAPALKKADIGVAMGQGGTEVAREAANMILTDDNFSTIVKAVKQGRTIYSNIRRFVFYLLTGNLTLVSIMIMTILFGVLTPFTALMILFVNIVSSTIPAMALSVEPKKDKVMRQHPRNPKEELLSSYILTKIFVMIPFMSLGTLGLYLWNLNIVNLTYEKSMTIAFVTIIMFILFHTLNARSLHTTIFNENFFKNKYLFGSMFLSFLLTLGAIYTSFGQLIFKTVPLSFMDWMLVLIVSSSVLIISELIKLSIKAEFKEQSNLSGKIYSLE